MNIPKEEELIFLCSSVRVGHVKKKRIKGLLEGPINWNTVLDLSIRHGVVALLYNNLNSNLFLNYLPADILKILRDLYQTNLMRNIAFCRELINILDLSRHESVNILPFKGIALAELVYQNPGLRIFQDVDILVREEELARVKAMLLEGGYVQIKQSHNHLFIKRISKDLSFPLEIHTAFVPARPYKIKIPQIWERAQAGSVLGRKIDYLSKEDTFLSQALHLRRHTRALLLKFVCDIAELMDLYKDSLDWRYINNIAEINRIKNSVYFCLYIAREILGLDTLEGIANIYKPHWLIRKCMYLCINKRNFFRPFPGQGYILRILLFDSFLDLLIYILRAAFKEKAVK